MIYGLAGTQTFLGGAEAQSRLYSTGRYLLMKMGRTSIKEGRPRRRFRLTVSAYDLQGSLGSLPHRLTLPGALVGRHAVFIPLGICT